LFPSVAFVYVGVVVTGGVEMVRAACVCVMKPFALLLLRGLVPAAVGNTWCYYSAAAVCRWFRRTNGHNILSSAVSLRPVGLQLPPRRPRSAFRVLSHTRAVCTPDGVVFCGGRDQQVISCPRARAYACKRTRTRTRFNTNGRRPTAAAETAFQRAGSDSDTGHVAHTRAPHRRLEKRLLCTIMRVHPACPAGTVYTVRRRGGVSKRAPTGEGLRAFFFFSTVAVPIK
jgi:hypothetical protein